MLIDKGDIQLYLGDCIEILEKAAPESVDMIFADPPYFLSNDGITCSGGKMVSVNKGKWDKFGDSIDNTIKSSKLLNKSFEGLGIVSEETLSKLDKTSSLTGVVAALSK